MWIDYVYEDEHRCAVYAMRALRNMQAITRNNYGDLVSVTVTVQA